MQDRIAAPLMITVHSSALAQSAAESRTLQSKIVAQNIEQGSRGIDIQCVHFPVHLQCEVTHDGLNFTRWYAAGEGKWVSTISSYAWTVIPSRVRTLYRNVLLDTVYASLPRDPEVKVQIYNAEIAPGGYTNWHCHNGATFFVALQGTFEAEFQEGVLIKAKAGDVYSEPIGKIHRGHNPHPNLPYLCIGICLTAPDREHVTNVIQPW